ncbi:glycoside hydrolase family 79 protein [Moniliophthora roreri MCA 2997]|uniref:Glycoside hydrolase family 79 protein n=1 Tax=Moniliophthora roreri (strain MCA 2997) TaxID=1381753 RepID=V2X385_MONRO|nr:glycoside hydrolase family 79 protein [Moniliophthora roreri MCA 2997]
MKPFLLLFGAIASPVSAVSVQLSSNAPSGAPVISGSHISLSLEQDRWTDWVGLNSRNQFFFNTLDNLARITGEPPFIRIGANSEDHTNFNQALQSPQTAFPPPTTTVPYPEASTIVVGDAYYQAARFLPPNTHVIWGVNFGQNNLTAAVLEAQSIAKAFSSSAITNAGISLDLLEIGNEADLYRNNGFRPSTFNISQYVKEWINFANNVSTAGGISSSSKRKFFGGAFAGSGHSNTSFSPQGMFANGILSSAPGSQISTISQHHYSGSFCSGNGGLLQDLMTKSTIRSNLSMFIPDIAASRARNLDYVLGETNSYSCHGAPGVSNTAGAALWTLDYALFARTLNITKVYFHEGIGYKYNLIQPVTLNRSTTDGSNLPSPLPPHVQPQYYAAIIAAEGIGNSGNTKISEISVNNTRISGYAFYQENKLARAIFINSQAFLSSSTNRSQVHLDFTFTGTTPSQMTVKRLAIGHADDTSGLLWGGQTYETADGHVAGTLSQEEHSVQEGLDLVASEAVLVTFK